jgi:plasmid rolling circle replication initiator protein Rep
MKGLPNKAESLKTTHNLFSKHNCGKVHKNSDLSTYRKRAKAKFAQNNLMRVMAKLNSPLKEKYEETQFCSYSLIQSGNTFTARYCKQRWCRICNRIRTGKLMTGYSDAIQAMQQPQFVTLTVPNVPGKILRETIKAMTATIQKIQDLRRKNKQPLLKAIRKLECTFNPDRNDYHPHLHLIIENKQQAEELKLAWMERNPKALEYLQDIRPAHNPIELFKYFAKLTSKSSKDIKMYKGKKLVMREEYHYPEALDLIFQAISGLRIIQPMGGVKMVSDEIEEIEAVEIDNVESDQALWQWQKIEITAEKYTYDWVNIFTGECLTGYEPTEKEWKYSKRIRYLQHC